MNLLSGDYFKFNGTGYIFVGFYAARGLCCFDIILNDYVYLRVSDKAQFTNHIHPPE